MNATASGPLAMAMLGPLLVAAAVILALVGCRPVREDLPVVMTGSAPTTAPARARVVVHLEAIADDAQAVRIRIGGESMRQAIWCDEDCAGWVFLRQHLDEAWDGAQRVSNGLPGERALEVELVVAPTLPWQAARTTLMLVSDEVDPRRHLLPKQTRTQRVRPIYQILWRCRTVAGTAAAIRDRAMAARPSWRSDAEVVCAAALVTPRGLARGFQPSEYRTWYRGLPRVDWDLRLAGAVLPIDLGDGSVAGLGQANWLPPPGRIERVRIEAFPETPLAAVLAARTALDSVPWLQGIPRDYAYPRRPGCFNPVGNALFELAHLKPFEEHDFDIPEDVPESRE